MALPFGILIALAVIALACLIKYVVVEVVEEQKIFFCIIGLFILIYIGAAIAIGFLNPTFLQRETQSAVIDERPVSI